MYKCLCDDDQQCDQLPHENTFYSMAKQCQPFSQSSVCLVVLIQHLRVIVFLLSLSLSPFYMFTERRNETH